ncbi:LPS biosynthesis glycosyltransferase [Scytonema sp. UIC 10036]|nr:LPS biosynthesis glycosyltransferase [Scytonema sp. UIC 10036]
MRTRINKLIPDSSRLVDCISQVFIIAYKESTQQLEETLIQEGFQCHVLRQEHKPDYKNFSPSYLCLLNHKEAWNKAAVDNRPTLIIEADFVPVVGLGKLPLPFNPHQTNVGISWLYTCAPQLYNVSANGYAEGCSVSTVAYIVTPQAAKILLELGEAVKKTSGSTAYSAWDSTIDMFLRNRNLKNYIPFRNYGEHGGLPNLEHSRYGLSKTHRADILYNKLAFMPIYATVGGGGSLKFLSVRFQARLKGIARLVLGKFLRLPILKGSSVPARLVNFAILRQLSSHL